MPTDTLLQAAGELTLADIVRFQYFHFARKVWPVMLVSVAMLFALVGIFSVLATGNIERWKNPGVQWVVLFFWTALALTGPYWAARRQRAQQSYLRMPMRYHFTADRVRLEGPQFSGEITWSLIRGIYETQNMFVLYHSPRMAWILPKRFFWNDERLVRQWRDWVIRQLPERKGFHKLGLLGRWM